MTQVISTNSTVNLVVLRHPEQTLKLKKELQKQKVNLVNIPLSKIIPINISLELCDIEESSAMIFVSYNAVVNFFSSISKLSPIILKHVINKPICAVGPTTANELFKYGCKDVFCPTENYGAEQALKLLAHRKISGNVLLIRGNYFNSIFKKYNGPINFKSIISYDISRAILTEYQYKYFKKNNFIAIVVASTKTLYYYFDYVKVMDSQALMAKPLIVVSMKMRQIALDLGFTNVYQSQSALNMDIIVVVNKLCTQGF